MKREIKFRGMSLNGDWHYGLLCVIKSGTRSHHKPGHYISNSVGIATAYPVRPDTVCQFTGLRDKNGKEIYENDILDENGNVFPVQWNTGDAGLNFDVRTARVAIVIGNEFEHPHLLS